MGMADAYSRINNGNRIGVFAMQAGPGAENAFPGIASAYSDSSPVLILPSGYPREREGWPRYFTAPRGYAGVTKWSDADYETAQNFRREFKKNVSAVMGQCDVLAIPTSTVAAAPIAEQPHGHTVERRKNACIFNFTGQPAISVPCGFTAAGLPVGMMLVGAMFADATVFRFAHAFEEATSWHTRHPEFS